MTNQMRAFMDAGEERYGAGGCGLRRIALGVCAHCGMRPGLNDAHYCTQFPRLAAPGGGIPHRARRQRRPYGGGRVVIAAAGYRARGTDRKSRPNRGRAGLLLLRLLNFPRFCCRVHLRSCRYTHCQVFLESLCPCWSFRRDCYVIGTRRVTGRQTLFREEASTGAPSAEKLRTH